MALSKNDQERIRGYLLGRLTDEEQQKIEERLMTDDVFFEELEISKEEVIEDYCAGELTPKEQAWLEQHFLASPEGKLRRRFAQALDRVQPPPPERLTLLDRFQALWRSQPWAVAAVASAAVLIVVGGVFFKRNLFSSETRTSLALTLISSSSTRGGETQPIEKVTLSPNIGELSITLILPEPTPPGVSYRAELDDSIKSKPIEIAQYDSKSVLVKVPSDQLRRGQYVVKLFTRDRDRVEQPIPARYFFNIE